MAHVLLSSGWAASYKFWLLQISGKALVKTSAIVSKTSCIVPKLRALLHRSFFCCMEGQSAIFWPRRNRWKMSEDTGRKGKAKIKKSWSNRLPGYTVETRFIASDFIRCDEPTWQFSPILSSKKNTGSVAQIIPPQYCPEGERFAVGLEHWRHLRIAVEIATIGSLLEIVHTAIRLL